MEASNSSNCDQPLAEGEEIIGVYGTKDQEVSAAFHSRGFIVWVPPKLGP